MPKITDLHSKIYDGLLSFLFIFLIYFTAEALIFPLQELASPGLLVYAAFLIAVAVYGLEQSMSWQHSEIQRAWGGIVGGIAGWVMVDVSIRMGMADIQRENGIFLWILAALVFYRLWKRVLPIGVRFWLGAFLLEWIGRVILAGQVYLAAWLPVFQVTYQLIGYGAMLAWAILLVWMFTRSRTRLTRLAGAVFMWFFATVILAFLQGGLV